MTARTINTDFNSLISYNFTMKIVALTSSYHIGASVSLERILKSKDYEVVGIVHHQVVSPDLKSLQKVKKMIEKAGILFIIKTGVVSILQQLGVFFARLLKRKHQRKLFNVEELAKYYNVPLFTTENTNSKNSQQFIREKKPDLLISCFLLQILKPKILNIPRKGAINIHPALLPKFAGSWTNFWVLFHKEKRAGATVHYMSEELDAGDIILQKSFRVGKKWNSLQCFTRKMAHFSADVLMQALKKIKQKKVKPQKMQKPKKLFTLPTKEDIEKSKHIFEFIRFQRFLNWF